MSKESSVYKAYEMAKEVYAGIGVDTEAALKTLNSTEISLHCWQGDDCSGFENADSSLTGGIMATGNYPGRARTPAELRQDIEKVMSLVPGKIKLNLHAIYLDTDEKVDRDAIEPRHFESWVDWAVSRGIGLDFNPTYFSHPMSAQGMTLSHPDKAVREFWIEHGRRCRKIAEYFGKRTGKPCVTNLWIPDGFKDAPVDPIGPRLRLKEALDEIYREKIDKRYNKDAVESKLFGIGLEAYTTGSHEFYMGYALANPDVMLTMDAGHYHPTEVISYKIAALLVFVDEILLHISRPVRWDSDHVVTFDDELCAIMQSIIRCGAINRVNIALDYFDASVNRLVAWVVGMRNAQKALLKALLEPTDALKAMERDFDFSSRLALTEEYKTYPFEAVWDYYCESRGVPVRAAWLPEVKAYEKDVLSKR